MRLQSEMCKKRNIFQSTVPAKSLFVPLERLLRVAQISLDFTEKNMAKVPGHKIWAIAEGYIPGRSNGPEPEFTSHETACILNAGDQDAHVRITVFFADREPAGPYRVTVGARRTLHLRFNDLEDPEPVPRDTDYACAIESDVPIVVQHTRMDTRKAEIALLSTMAYGES